MTIGIIARVQIKDGKNEEFERIFKELTDAVRANEPDNLLYALHRCRENPNTYVVMEQYTDDAALDAHRQSDHFKTQGAKMGDCLAGAPEIEYLDAV